MTALLALPFSGGAFTFTLSVSSSQPAMQSFDDDGMTFIFSFTCRKRRCSLFVVRHS